MAIAQIDLSHRVTMVGSTGDGKTTMGLKILGTVARAKGVPTVIINPLAEPKLYDMFGAARPDIDTTWPEIQHVAPHVTLDMRNYGRLFGELVVHGNVAVYIDEVIGIGDAHRFSVWLKFLYQMGRRRNCFTLAVTQRPIDIPPFILKMSDHVFVGDVMGQDLKKVEEHTQQKWADTVQQRGPYEFGYWCRHVKEPPKLVRMP